VFTEIMADATPSLGFPEDEFLEITNISDREITIIGLYLEDESGEFLINPDGSWGGVLASKERFIICRDIDLWDGFAGNIAEVGTWSGLKDAGELIQLFRIDEELLDAVNYQKSWWDGDQPGRSISKLYLEGCSIRENWSVSEENIGASPFLSSTVEIEEMVTDTVWSIKPRLLNSNEIVIEISPLMDPLSLGSIKLGNSDSYGVWEDLEYSEYGWLLDRGVAISCGKPQTLSLRGFTNCFSGELFNKTKPCWTPIRPPLSGELVITEICHTPIDATGEWIEVMNIAGETLDYLGTLIRPGERHIQYPNLTLPDDGGTALLTLFDDTLDLVRYNKCWHDGPEKSSSGYSLERIDPLRESNDPENWMSGTSSWGATPGTAPEVVLQKSLIQTEILWGISNGRIIMHSNLALDSSILKASNWEPQLGWQFLNSTLTTAISDAAPPLPITLKCNHWKPLSRDPSVEMVDLKLTAQNDARLFLNELLSNPQEEYGAFIEIKNDGTDDLSLEGWMLTSTESPLPDDWSSISNYKWIVPSGKEIALSSCSSWLKNLNELSLCLDIEMPSLQRGRTLRIGSFVNEQTDSLPLDDDTEGVSMERLNSLEDNWVLAPMVKGGSSPGRPNHNQWSEDELERLFEVFPQTLRIGSIDNAWINISISEEAMMKVATVSVYSAVGEPICQYEMTPENRHVIWEGVDNNSIPVLRGNYVVELMLENIGGDKIIQRRLVVVAE
jgi:hypothetical protein